MESEGSPGAVDLAAELSQAIGRLSNSGEAVTHALTRRPRIDPVAVKDALVSVRRATRLLDRLSAMVTALERHEAAAPTADPVDVWACAVATAIEQADPVSLRELAEQPPHAVPPMIATAARAAATGDWGTGRLLADYALGRIVSMGTSPELGRIAGATAVLAARVWMTEAPQRCQGYLQLAQSHSGSTGRLEAALAQRQRTTGDLGLAQDSAVLACSLDPGYPRGHVERALALAAVGSDSGEAVQTAADTASVRNHPYEALTDLVDGVPDAVLLRLAQTCQTDRPEVARRVLDELLTAAEPRPLSQSEDRRETVLRQAEAYRLRAALPRMPNTSRPDADAGTVDSAADLYSAAVLVIEFDQELCYELLKQVLTYEPQHRRACFLLGELLRVRAEGAAVPRNYDLLDKAADQLKQAEQSPTPATNVEWERRILATLLMSQASARPQSALGSLLQAALQLERSVLDGTASAWLYMLQSQLFSRLDLWSWARAALERAAQLSHNEVDLWEAQVLLDVNSGADEAVVEQTAERTLPDWSRGARAIALAELGNPPAAVELLAQLVSQAGAPMWYRAALARAHVLAGQHEAARAQLEEIVTAERTRWPEDYMRATALLRLGRLEEAEEGLRQWRPEPSDLMGRQWHLALCRLVREPHEARGSLLDGLEAEALPSALRNAAWEFDAVREVVERLDVDDPRRAEALAALHDAREVVDRRLRGPHPAPDRQSELQRCLQLWLTPLDGSDSSLSEQTSAACTLAAGLTARLATEQSIDAQDMALYAELRGTALDDMVPEVLRRRSAEVRAEIGAAVSRGDHQQARMLYQVLVATAGDPVTPDLAALGVALAVRRGDLPEILEACAQALAAAPTIADAARCVLSADLPVDQETLLQGLAATATASHGTAEGSAGPGAGARTDGIAAGIAPGTPSPASTLLVAVSAEIGRRATEDVGRHVPVEYDTRRLIAELGEALVPQDTSSAWKLFSQDIPAMRKRVKDRLGLDLPGVLVRRGVLDSYAFRVLLDGLEVMTGELVPHEQADGVPAPERLEVLTEAIERTVLAAPGSFLSVSQFELLVQQAPAFWEDTAPNPSAISELAELTASPETMVRLVGILQALLDDGLHVREIADLVTLVQRAGGLSDHRADVLRRIRSEASGHLLAAQPGSRGLRLREDLEREAKTAAEIALVRPGGADGRDGPPPRSAEIVDLLVRTWPEVLQTCRATEMPVVVVADEPTRTWLQRVLREHLLPGVAVTTAEVPGLATEVPPAWRSPDPVTPQEEPLPLPGSQ